MKAYFGTLIAASLAAALVGILCPEGERGGIGKHMRLLISLFLVVVIASPLSQALQWLADAVDGGIVLPEMQAPLPEDYQGKLDSALDAAGEVYFAQMLIQCLEAELGIGTGDVRCEVSWQTDDSGKTSPARVTVVLSGKAIWQDPHVIEEFVTALLACPCQVAIA